MTKKNIALLFFCLSFLTISSCASNLRIHPGFNAGGLQGKTLAILQPEMTLFTEWRNKKTPQPQEKSREFQRNVKDALADCLMSGPLTVLADTALDSVAAMSRITSDSLFEASEKGLEGQLILNVPHGMQVDYLLIAKGTGYQKRQTPVNIIRSMTTVDAAYSKMYSMFIEIAVVDVQTGRIEWYNRNQEVESGYNPMNFDHVRSLCGKLLETLSRDIW